MYLNLLHKMTKDKWSKPIKKWEINYFLIATLLILFKRQKCKLFNIKNMAIKKWYKDNNKNKTKNLLQIDVT